MKYLFSITAVLLFLGCALAGCSSAPTQALEHLESTTTDLVGSQWELTTFQRADGTTVPIPSEETYTLLFETRTELSGRAANCDPYAATYEAGGDGALTVGTVSSSFVLCEVQSPITIYFEALGSAHSYERTGDELRLVFGDQGVLRYRQGNE